MATKNFRKNLIILPAASLSHAYPSVRLVVPLVLLPVRSGRRGASLSPLVARRDRGPVVLKSGRNRRYRPVARPVIAGRAVTNQVSGPRPSGHFPAPTWGPCRPRPPSLPVYPAGRGVALEAPRRLFPSPPSFPPSLTQILRRSPSRKPGSLERVPLRAARSQPPSMPRCPCAFLGLLDVACRDESVCVASLLSLSPPFPLL